MRARVRDRRFERRARHVVRDDLVERFTFFEPPEDRVHRNACTPNTWRVRGSSASRRAAVLGVELARQALVLRREDVTGGANVRAVRLSLERIDERAKSALGLTGADAELDHRATTC